MCSISPFSIPHIVDSICDHLNLDDIYNCKKVCKDWSDVFAPYEWRSLHMATEYDHKGPSSPEKRNLILKHAHRTESLTIRQDDIWLLQSSCLNFKRLIYVHVIFILDSFGVYPLTHISLLQDLSHCAELRLAYPGHSRYYPQTTNDAVVVAMALSDCPPNVESLHVSYYNAGYPGKTHTPQNHPSSFILPWEPLSLRKFLFDCAITCSFQGLTNIGLIPFLKNCCPLLEDLSLPSFPEEDCEALMKTIGAHCPKLQYLRLNDDDIGVSPFGSEIDHFVYITQPLKFLKIDLDYRHDTTVLEPLRRNGSDALEALEFRNTAEYDLSEYIPPYDWFPNLKTVNYHKSDSEGLEVHLWTRPLEITANDDRHREDVREYYTSIVNMSH
ncbi:MAG: hypothetical protein J3R72DRAFT_432166, partial [Linnemannia gamsii]